MEPHHACGVARIAPLLRPLTLANEARAALRRCNDAEVSFWIVAFVYGFGFPSSPADWRKVVRINRLVQCTDSARRLLGEGAGITTDKE